MSFIIKQEFMYVIPSVWRDIKQQTSRDIGSVLKLVGGWREA